MALFIFTQLVGKPLLDTQQEKVATLKDIVVRINPDVGKSEETYPPYCWYPGPHGWPGPLVACVISCHHRGAQDALVFHLRPSRTFCAS